MSTYNANRGIGGKLSKTVPDRRTSLYQIHIGRHPLVSSFPDDWEANKWTRMLGWCSAPWGTNLAERVFREYRDAA